MSLEEIEARHELDFSYADDGRYIWPIRWEEAKKEFEALRARCEKLEAELAEASDGYRSHLKELKAENEKLEAVIRNYFTARDAWLKVSAWSNAEGMLDYEELIKTEKALEVTYNNLKQVEGHSSERVKCPNRDKFLCEKIADLEAELAKAQKENDIENNHISEVAVNLEGENIQLKQRLSELEAELANLRTAVQRIRSFDCGAWLKEGSIGFALRTELMRLLDNLYKIARNEE